MDELLTAFLAFPTVIWSVLLVLVLVYWAFVFLGALDLDLFDMDADMDVDVDVDMDADVDADMDAGGGGAGFAKAMAGAGLTGVPVMLSMSFLVLFAWSFSMLGVLLLPWVGAGGLVGVGLSVALFVASFGLALPVAVVAIGPFKKMFHVHRAPRRGALVGRRCRVTTQRVDSSFGQAEIDERGASFLVQVRASVPNAFEKDSEAVIYEYDADAEIFHIAPVQGSE